MSSKLPLAITLLCTLAACQPVSREVPDSPTPASFSQGLEKSYIDTHNGYSEAVAITSGGIRTLHISGQVGEGEDLEAQMRSAIGKLEALLEGQGATMKDVVKMNTYIVDYGPESLDVFRGVRAELMGDTDMPASTLVGVEALALPEWLIEIEAVAVLPAE